MALFGSSKRTAFKPTPYGSTRKKRRVPRWLILMLTGVVLGSGGLLFIQKSYGPTLLTVEQADQLRQDLNSTNLDKQRLLTQVDRQTHELDELRTALEKQTLRADSAEKSYKQLSESVQVLADAVPADPRGTSPGIRAADFTVVNGQLAYKLLVMQNSADAPAFSGKMDFAVEGRYPNGHSTTVDIPVSAVEIGHYTALTGATDLPRAFTPVQVTIRIRDQADKLAATRTIRVTR